MKRATHDDVIRHMPVAWAYAHRLMDQPEDAEAAAQDALATVVDELPSLKSKQVRKRLKQEVRAFEAKAALAAAEREKARKLARTRTDTLAKDATNQALLKGWRKETLHAVSELPDQMRRVFTLTALEGRSNADAARVLKLDQKQVARLRKRASRALFDKLSERGGGRTGWVLLLPLFRGLSPGSHTSAWAWFIGVLSVGLVALGWQSFADDKRDAGQSPYADQSIQSGLELSGAADSERKLVLVDAPSPIEPEVNESQAAEAKEEPEKPKLVTPEATKLERSIVTPPTFIEDMRYQQIIEIPDENIRVETVSFQHREGIEWERPKIKSGPFAGELHGIGRRYSQVPTPEGKEWVEAEYLVELGKPLETRVFNMEGDVIKRLFPFSEQVLEVWDLKKEKDGTSRWVRNVSRYVVATNNDHIGAKKIEKADLPVG
ncbi:MAG: hypothetical protein KDB07_09910, partial [Planctomycetes bacterium]|nr:hypothetical protein [Planctomycetota bacterium]